MAFPCGLSAYVNAAASAEAANCKLAWLPELPLYPWLVATKAIGSGQELLFEYIPGVRYVYAPDRGLAALIREAKRQEITLLSLIHI